MITAPGVFIDVNTGRIRSAEQPADKADDLVLLTDREPVLSVLPNRSMKLRRDVAPGAEVTACRTSGTEVPSIDVSDLKPNDTLCLNTAPQLGFLRVEQVPTPANPLLRGTFTTISPIN